MNVPTDGLNAAAEPVGVLALSLLTGMGQAIEPHPCQAGTLNQS